MADNYKPIPEGTTRLKLYAEWCGDEECNCFHLEIRAVNENLKSPFGNPVSLLIWDSDYMEIDRDFPGELREQTKKACEHYGITADLSDNSIYDWGTEKAL